MDLGIKQRTALVLGGGGGLGRHTQRHAVEPGLGVLKLFCYHIACKNEFHRLI